MRKLGLLTFLILSFSISAQEFLQILTIPSAKIIACKRSIMGCYPRIEYGKESHILDTKCLPKSLEDRVLTVSGAPFQLTSVNGIKVNNEFKILSSDPQATVSFCDPSILGCALYITVNGEKVIMEETALTESVTDEATGRTMSVSVLGYFMHKKKTYPKPVTYKVFKVLEITNNEAPERTDASVDVSSRIIKLKDAPPKSLGHTPKKKSKVSPY